MALHHKVAQVALTEAYSEISRLLGTLADSDLQRPSRCAGWVVGDVLFHLLTDAQAVLVAMSGSVTDRPASDWLTYWRREVTRRSPRGARQQARYVRLGAAAYTEPDDLVRHWNATSQAVLRVTEYAPGARGVPYDGITMNVTDVFAVVAVEATIHHLDMLAELAGKPQPRPAALELTVRTLDGLLGDIDRPHWEDVTFVSKMTGRLPLTVSERRFLDERGFQLPLIG